MFFVHACAKASAGRRVASVSSMPYTILNKKLLPKSQLELALEIDAATIAATCAQVLEEAAREADLDGFRKGKVPKDIIRKRMGELVLWEEAAMRALSESLAGIFTQNAIDVVGRPAVSVTKLAPDNPAGFKVVVSLFPKLSLPDYRALAAKHNSKPAESAAVEEKEVDAVVAEMTKEHERRARKTDFKVSDETVKELGEFASVADLRTKVAEGLAAHKKNKAAEKRRAKLLDALVSGATGELPDVLVEQELNRFEAELEGQLKAAGASLEQYLKEIRKDRDTVRAEWRPDAERRARLELLLAEIARKEHISAPQEEVDAEVKQILERYKDAKSETARLFVENVILNRKVIQFLEDQK